MGKASILSEMVTSVAEIGAALVPATSYVTVKVPVSLITAEATGLVTAKTAFGAKVNFEASEDSLSSILA